MPLLGKPFSSTGDTARRTELPVLITPRAMAGTEEFRKKLRRLAPSR